MRKIFTSRTPSEDYLRCKRMRWLGHHEGEEGMGIQLKARSLALAVGGAVHEGLATLLILSRDIDPSAFAGAPWRFIEDQAVMDGLADFEKAAKDGLEVELNELQLVVNDPGLATSLSLDDLGFGTQIAQDEIRNKFRNPPPPPDPLASYLYKEQSALVEAMVRAYSRRRLQPLLEQFEVLEVEREGEWKLGEYDGLHNGCFREGEDFELWFQSRPDALLRERSTGDLHIMSFKTTGQWDKRKDKDAQRDMQGLSEGVEVEVRLAQWWMAVRNDYAEGNTNRQTKMGIPFNVVDWLNSSLSCSSPPRISAIRYEYLLKGYRSEDKQQPGRWVQNTSLVRPYISHGMTSGDVSFAHSYEWTDQSTMKQKRLDYRTWKRGLITDHIPVSTWIDMLDRGEVQDTATDENGWVIDPLKDAFVPAVTVYRQDDDLRDWIEQEEAQEVQVAQDVEQVQSATDSEEKRSLLNQLFPQTRRACSYPGECAFVHVCYGSAEAKTDPLGTGLYTIRIPNHPIAQE